jgi:hypothetical protein
MRRLLFVETPVNPKRGLPLLAVVGLLAPPVLGLLHPRLPNPRRPSDDDEATVTKVYVNMPSLSLETMTNAATDIIRGRVLDMRAVIPDSGIAYTEVDLEVSWALKGLSVKTLTLHVPGVADKQNPTIVDRAPRLAIGDDVMLFLLLDDETGVISILGLDEGVYKIATDDKGQELVFGKQAVGVEVSEFTDSLGK